MLLKILVLMGLAIYFWPEAGLSFLALSALIPRFGLVLAVILVIVLLVKSWYGSAAIVAGLIAFNLVGNAFLEKQSPSLSESTDQQLPIFTRWGSMFGWFKRRLAARMNALANVAQLTTTASLFSYFRVQQAPDEAEKSVRAAKACAIANHFFGKESDAVHTIGFDLPALYAEGEAWLRNNPLFKELVVQSLRVLSTVEFARSRRVLIIGEALLVKFGPEFPIPPNPETYAALVSRAVESLPPEERDRVKRWAQTGS